MAFDPHRRNLSLSSLCRPYSLGTVDRPVHSPFSGVGVFVDTKTWTHNSPTTTEIFVTSVFCVSGVPRPFTLFPLLLQKMFINEEGDLHVQITFFKSMNSPVTSSYVLAEFRVKCL